MSEVAQYKCDQCGKVETNLLYWWINNGNLDWNEGGLSFKVHGLKQHWCSSVCLKKWIDEKTKIIDGKFYKQKNDH